MIYALTTHEQCSGFWRRTTGNGVVAERPPAEQWRYENAAEQYEQHKRKMKCMKKLRILILALSGGAMLALPSVSRAATITGTDHDLSGRGWGFTEICIACHTPHNAQATQLVPLWNHTNTVATFTLYSSGTLNATMSQPAGTSKACLSCHDGTVAIDAFVGGAGTHTMTGGHVVGTALSDDHPVSFTYDAALATSDGGLVSPSSASLVVTGIPLFGSKLECASCHNAHNNANGDFLRVANTGSALCLKCHSK
jgi:predicted CXXCH cytochrome family protein